MFRIKTFSYFSKNVSAKCYSNGHGKFSILLLCLVAFQTFLETWWPVTVVACDQRCCKYTFNANEVLFCNLRQAKRPTKAPSKYEYTDPVNLKFRAHERKRDFRQFTVEVIHHHTAICRLSRTKLCHISYTWYSYSI